MKRLLCITANMNTGGAETFLMKMYRAIDRSKYQMDFCVATEQNYYADEIRNLGGKIYLIPLKSKHPIASFNAIRSLVKSNSYKSVLRINQHALSTVDLLAAKSGGASRLAMRSSNASSGSRFSDLLHRFFRPLTLLVPNIRFAPSKDAAEYTFGKGCIEKKVASLLYNGLDTNRFRFDPNERASLRKELNLGDNLVVGHVGRFNYQKNHAWLIEVFLEVYKRNPGAILLLVGDGSLFGDVKRKVDYLGLSGNVKFMGVQSDIPCIMSSMDVLVLPSFYEGMPNVVIEAQANGLPCVVADSVTQEAAVTDLVKFVGLSEASKTWADTIEEVVSHQVHRSSYADLMRARGYEIKKCAERFVELVYGE